MMMTVIMETIQAFKLYTVYVWWYF